MYLHWRMKGWPHFRALGMQANINQSAAGLQFSEVKHSNDIHATLYVIISGKVSRYSCDYKMNLTSKITHM